MSKTAEEYSKEFDSKYGDHMPDLPTSKAEQRALERFPEEMTPLVYQEQIDLFGGKTEVDFNLLPRSFFQLGYEQAEKDLTDIAMFSSGLDGFYYGKGYQQGKKDAEKDLGWICVKDRLPETTEYVFTCVNQFGVPQCIGFHYYKDGKWWEGYEEDVVGAVEYWMPIPKFKEAKK